MQYKGVCYICGRYIPVLTHPEDIVYEPAYIAYSADSGYYHIACKRRATPRDDPPSTASSSPFPFDPQR